MNEVGRLAALVALTALIAGLPSVAQQSASYRNDEHVLNAAGTGTQAATGFRITLSSVGEGLVAPASTSASYAVSGGLVGRYAPPGEVGGVVFADPQTLQWDAHPPSVRYRVYRDGSASGHGACLDADVGGVSFVDPAVPGSGFFYLVTAVNRLGEEGTKGDDTAGVPRGGGTCP